MRLIQAKDHRVSPLNVSCHAAIVSTTTGNALGDLKTCIRCQTTNGGIVKQLEVPPRLGEILAKAHEPQRGFSWNAASWKAALGDCPAVLTQLDALPQSVNRDEVCKVVTTNLARRSVLPAFVTAMVWGYGTAGYGPARVRWVLTGIRGRGAYDAPIRPDVAERLGAAVQVVRDLGAVEGFRHMNNAGHIKYLGGAFFTKWLYFTSAASGRPDDAMAAPILDKQIKDWLAANARLDLNINRTPDYQRYVELLTQWGAEFDRTAVQVEKAIFHLATGR